MLDELCLLQISGAQLLRALENSVSQYPRLEGRFAQVSGIVFTFDAAKPSGARVVQDSVRIDGKDIDKEKKYTIATKDYLRQGKDGYDMLKDATCLADGEQTGVLPNVVKEHIQACSATKGKGTASGIAP